MTISPRLSALLALLAILAPSMIARAGVYQLVDYPDLQNGLAVSGTINAADLNRDMVLDPDELSSWSLTIDGNTATSGHPAAGSRLTNVTIADGMIFLEDPRLSGVSEQFILAIALGEFVNYYNGPYSTELNDQIYNGRSGEEPSPSWRVQTAVTGGPNLAMPAANGRMVIARLAPEPDALVMLIIALMAMAAGRRGALLALMR